MIPSEILFTSYNNYLFDKKEYQMKNKDLFTINVNCTLFSIPHFNTIQLPNDNHSALILEQAIKQFSSKEKLDGQWRCQQCNQYSQAIKAMFVYSCSYYLLIHLKRFKDNHKDTSLVIFPLTGLDMSEYTDNPNQYLIYDLIGVINHSGSLHGGHYYTYAKNIIDDQWYVFNDSSVSRISESDIVKANASTLLYKIRVAK